jgi:hypothetical protein
MADRLFPPPGACACDVHVVGPRNRFPATRFPIRTSIRALLALVPRWLEDDARVGQVLLTNPARLYDFPKG